MRLMKRMGWLAASIVLASSAGCGNNTEVKLADVAPVVPKQDGPRQPSRGRSAASPDVLPGR